MAAGGVVAVVTWMILVWVWNHLTPSINLSGVNGRCSPQQAGNKRGLVLIKLWRAHLILNTGFDICVPKSLLLSAAFAIPHIRMHFEIAFRTYIVSHDAHVHERMTLTLCLHTSLCRCSEYKLQDAALSCSAKVVKNDGEREQRRSRSPGWSVFCHLKRCLFFSAQVSFHSSPPYLLDRYSASIKVWKKAQEHLSQSTLTKLKAMEFEISQPAVSTLLPLLPVSVVFLDCGILSSHIVGVSLFLCRLFKWHYEKLYKNWHLL